MCKPHEVARKLSLLLAATLLAALPCWPQREKPAGNSGPDQDLKDFRLDELGARLRVMPPGVERDYFAGMLANRTNHIEESIELLGRVLPAIREARPDRAKEALDAQAENYMKTFRYDDAMRAMDDLVVHFAPQFRPAELRLTKDDAGIARILREAPGQTIEWHGGVALKIERNPINSQNVELTVNGVQGPWLLDTGAGLSVVTKSQRGGNVA